MNKDELIKKFLSRKFLALLSVVIICTTTLLGVNDDTTQKIIALLSSTSACIAYILVEGYNDSIDR